MGCTSEWQRLLKLGVIAGVLSIQERTQHHLPWLGEVLARHVNLNSHPGPLRPEFYTSGVPSGPWLCVRCGRTLEE
jgi:hypothetical protein